MDVEKFQQKSNLKRKLSLDLEIIKPIITKVHYKFPIKYINIPTSQLITQCIKKELGISHNINNLYQPLKHQQGIWSKSGIKNYCPLYLGNEIY